MTDTLNNTIQSPPPKRRVAGTMSSSTPSLQPSALDRTRSLRKPTSTARLMKDTTTTGAVGTSAGSSATRGAGVGGPKQRPVSMIQMPSTKGALPAPGSASRTAGTSSIGTAVSGSGIKRMASVRSGTNNSNIKPPASGGLNRLASTRLKREGGKLADADVGTGAEVGSGISSGSGSRVGSGAAMATSPTTSTTATKSTTSTISSLRQPLRARVPTVSKATPLSPPTTTTRSVSGPFGMTRPTTSSSSGSMATITSPRATATSGSGTRIGTGIGLAGRGHARTQSATISSPKPKTPKPAPRNPAASGTSAIESSKGTTSTEVGVAGGSGSEPPKSASKGVLPPSTPGKSRPQRSPATATPKPATAGGTPKTSTGTVLRSSPAHKRQNSASSVSTTGTKARTAANPGTATSTAPTQTRRLAASRRPLSVQAPEAAIANIVKLAPKILSSTRPPATATTTATATKPPPSRQPNTTASSSLTTAKPSVPKPKTHLPAPHATQQHPQPRHDFDTYQQHYTPAKIPLLPKPLTSTFLAPPTPSKQPQNTELLQLHLLHRDAEWVRGEWEGDAKEKLRERWERLRWAGDGLGLGHGREEGVVVGGGKLEEEKIQALDEVVSGVWAMSEPSSSSSSSSSGITMGKFEVWAERAARILEERRSAADDEESGGLKLDANGEVEMVGGLDVDWKNECVALGRRLEEWRRMLGELGGVVEDIEGGMNEREEKEEDESALDRILSGFGSLVDNMLAELEVMEQIEREAVAEENEWVRRMNRVDDEKEGEEIIGKRAGAIWRAL
ncbi:hypothetical protein B0H65DRAFT_559649 [Neurospora tetraspora]|uniref:Uncharacterized protein n=1 Tax=Neurospora tetraspora TaxID=94610 RepID=A0AAE0JAK7_9PEZI|nr:hypothetical protein B0H65DRAFT_559649 [Neurospora tetraspora]